MERSHANNWNSKFFDSDQINKNNIQNLKLLWKFSTIENDELENKWKENIEVNQFIMTELFILFLLIGN